MSKSQLQTNNSKLSALITELQGKAAGGSGGGNVETCTVRAFTTTPRDDFVICGPVYVDGVSNSPVVNYDLRLAEGFANEITVNNVACGSVAIFEYLSRGYEFTPALVCNGCEWFHSDESGYVDFVFITAAPGETATIEFVFEE